jgi:DNA-binding transcriptional LysR family regulator
MRLSGLDLNLHMVFDAVYEERSLEKAAEPFLVRA